jgi:uncharacterized protein YukE
MIETNASQSNSHASGAESGRTTQDIRERAERLQRKVAELSKTFDHIEQTLNEAGGEKEISKD